MSLFKRTPEERQALADYKAIVGANQRAEQPAATDQDAGAPSEPHQAIAEAAKRLIQWPRR